MRLERADNNVDKAHRGVVDTWISGGLPVCAIPENHRNALLFIVFYYFMLF